MKDKNMYVLLIPKHAVLDAPIEIIPRPDMRPNATT